MDRVVVIGAGTFGVWTAWHLLKNGADVTLLDTWGPGNARASSGGETRVIRAAYGDDRIYVDLVRRSMDHWVEAESRWQTRLYERKGGLWMFGEDDSYARDSIPHAEANGLLIEELPLSEAEVRFPGVGWDGVEHAYYEPEAGFLYARHACATVCQGIQAQGGVYRRVEARPGPLRSESMQALELADGEQISADAYLFACGPWLGDLFPDVIGGALQISRQELHFFGPPARAGALDPESFPVWADLGETAFYGIPSAAGRGFKLADDTRGPSVDPTTQDRTPSPEGIDRVRQFLRRRFPELADAPLLEARVCQYANSPDGHFIADRHPEANNVWLLGGGSGHGFKLSPALAEQMAAAILKGQRLDPLFRIERLTTNSAPRTQLGRERPLR